MLLLKMGFANTHGTVLVKTRTFILTVDSAVLFPFTHGGYSH